MPEARGVSASALASPDGQLSIAHTSPSALYTATISCWVDEQGPTMVNQSLPQQEDRNVKYRFGERGEAKTQALKQYRLLDN